MPIGAVIISMFYVICWFVLHYALPKSVLYRNVCYIYFLSGVDSSTAPELYMRLYLCIFHHIKVCTLICLCMLYNLIVGSTSSWVLFSNISPI